MNKKLMLNFSDTSAYAKVLPLIGLGAGIALAKYQKKDCIGCYLGYGLSGLLIGSIPLIAQAKKSGDAVVSVMGVNIEIPK